MPSTIGLRPGPIAIGSAVSIGGSLLASIILETAYAVILISQGVTPAELESRVQADLGFYVVALAIGLGFSVLGAFVAARRTPAQEIPNALATGVVCILFGAFLYAATSAMDGVPAWYSAAAFALTLPFAWLGGALAQGRHPPAASR